MIARGAHLDAIRTKGMEAKGARLGDFLVRAPAESDPAAIGPVDVAIVLGQLTVAWFGARASAAVRRRPSR